MAFWLLGGFSGGGKPATGPVTVTPPPTGSTQVDTVCRALLAALPDTLDGKRQRQVSAAAERVAAWGDPPIVLRCGVAARPAPDPTALVLGVNGVDWVTTEENGATVWTTVSRSVTVEVRIPAKYADGAGDAIINPLTGPLRTAVPAAR